ncbi:MAG: hypothetical protein Q7U32_04840 [Rhodocyclaceae bacterium]|jgi:hypothetical protein|nr:hypothetical protein [Rhodocyclaceae bacterium]
MRGLLVAINALLVLVILGLALFWHPAADQPPSEMRKHLPKN